MGLPELTFSLKKAADNVATRVSSGIVAMILRDAKANGLHTINRESDIPSELGAANIAAIKRAMLGYITKPTTLYVSVIGADADIKTGFQALAVHSYDYLVGPQSGLPVPADGPPRRSGGPLPRLGRGWGAGAHLRLRRGRYPE